MTATLERPPADRSAGGRSGNGGAPARRAVVRWAWRLFRREWRQQLLVLALLTVAVAATTAGVAVATSAARPPATTVSLPGSDPQLAADLAAFHDKYGSVPVMAHQKVAVPGSVATVDLQAEHADPGSRPRALHLLAGAFPTGPDDVAVTPGVAGIFALRIGDTWQASGRALHVVGRLENPMDLHEDFALLAPGRLDPPATVTILLDATWDSNGFRLPSGTPLAIQSESPVARSAAAAAVLALATIGLVFVGLVAVAGFTVMAQRRLRAMGMLGSIGATDGNVRLVMLANGAAVGAVGAVAGAALGLAGWIAFAPRLESAIGHRIDRFGLAWWAVGAAMVLAVVTAIAAAWWPARAVARISVVAALSGRPPRTQRAHRSAAVGGLVMATGLVLLGFSHQRRVPFVVGGTVATTLGLLLLAPSSILGLAAAGRRAPISVRLALRDLARYRARSGAALGAISLAVGIAATVAVSAAGAQATTDATTGGNLPANQLVVYLAPQGLGAPVVVDRTPAELAAVQTTVDGIAAALPTQNLVGLDVAVNPATPEVPGLAGGQGGKEPAALVRVVSTPRGFGFSFVAPLYVATSTLLTHFGVEAGQVDPAADVLTSRTDMAGLQLGAGGRDTSVPKVQMVKLPRYSSGPNSLITTHAVQALGLRVVPAAWLLQTPRSLTATQIDTARRLAAAAGLTVETRPTRQSLTQLGRGATAAGMLLALGVLAMTVGLIRSETANDLRILAATGASSTARRSLTGATAAALALLGGLLGTAGAYLALVAWHRSDLDPLRHPPVANLLVIVVGLPLAAVVAGWLLAGREPAVTARRPLE